jgi:hypothetical protein
MYLIEKPTQPNQFKVLMEDIPCCDYLKDHTNEYSAAEAIKCVGPHYASQIETICGGRHLGDILQFFSDKPLERVLPKLRQCCRNKRAGELNACGGLIPEANPRVMESMIKVLALGRKHPEYFRHYRVHICIPSAALNTLLHPPAGN